MGFPGGSDSKEFGHNVGDLGLISGFERAPRRRHGNPLQYSGLEYPHGQRSLVGYNLWGCKELDMTEQLSTTQQPFAYSGSISQLWEKEFRRINMVEKNREFQDPQFLSDW